MKSVGIDIGSYSIKVAELSGSGRSVQIDDLREYPLSQKPGTDKELELITTLKEILDPYNKEETKFVLGLPQDKVSMRILFFPFKEKFKILKSLPFELEDLIPFSSFDAVFEGKIIKTLPGGSEVLSVAAHKSLIKSQLNLASDVQIDPDIISLEGFALNNLFEDIFSPPPEAFEKSEWPIDEVDDEESAQENKSDQVISEKQELVNGEAILDLGHSSSTLIVRAAGGLQNIRRVNWGALNLAEAVAKHYNIQTPEALQKIIASKGLALKKIDASFSEQDQELSNVLYSEVQKLGRILKLTLLEIKGSNLVDIKGIGLLGGLSSLNNLGPKITEFTLVASNPILQIKNHPEVNLSRGQGSQASMGVAIGLGLESFRRPQNPAINFRRDEFEKENSTFKHFWQDWGFYINLAAASIFIFFVYANLRLSITEELTFSARNNMRSAAAEVFKIEKYDASERKLSKLFNELDQREETKEKILKLSQQMAAKPLKQLRQISEKASSRSVLPIDITELQVSSQLVKIEGSTTARNELQRFSKKLESISKGKITKTERPSRLGSGYDFSISFKPKASF